MIAAPRPAPAQAGVQSASLCRALLNLTSATEAGLAETPLSNAVSLLLEKPAQPALRVAVLGLTAAAQSDAVRLLIGSDAAFHVCQIVAPGNGNCRYLEITLRDHGFLLDAGGERTEFDSAESLIQTLKRSDGVRLRSSLAEPLRLGLAASHGSHGLTLLLPEGLQELKDRPDLFSYLADQADALLLAGRAGDELPDSDHAIIENMLGGIGVVQTLVFADDGDPIPGWTRLDAAFVLPPVAVRPPADPETGFDGAPLLAEDRPPVRRLLGEVHRVRSAGVVMSLLKVRLQEEISRCQLKRQLSEMSPAGPAAGDDRYRTTAEQLSRRAVDEMKTLAQSMEEQTKAALMPSGSLANNCREIANAVHDVDFDQHDEEKVTRLSIGANRLQRIQAQVHATLVNIIHHDEAITNEAVAACCEDLTTQKQQLCGDSAPVQIPARVNLSKVVQFADAVVKTPMRLRGEIARKTKKQIMMEIIQQPVMVIMTLLMPLSFLSSWDAVREKVGHAKLLIGEWLLPPIYLVFSLYLIREYRRERQTGLRKELDKIRDGIVADLDRWIRQVLDEKKRVLGDYLTRATEEIRRQVAEGINAVAKQQEHKRAAERQNGAALLQALDRRKAEMTARMQQLDALAREAEQTRKALQGEFSAALKV